MHADREMPAREQPNLDTRERRMRIDELTAVLALQAHDLAALGRIDLVKPMLTLKVTLQTMSSDVSGKQVCQSDAVIASAVELINAANEILGSEYRLMTIH